VAVKDEANQSRQHEPSRDVSVRRSGSREGRTVNAKRGKSHYAERLGERGALQIVVKRRCRIVGQETAPLNLMPVKGALKSADRNAGEQLQSFSSLASGGRPGKKKLESLRPKTLVSLGLSSQLSMVFRQLQRGQKDLAGGLGQVRTS